MGLCEIGQIPASVTFSFMPFGLSGEYKMLAWRIKALTFCRP